ncbi:MAG: hypothetical protein HY341_00475 [Candidatus Kerfeldbacteria bacterium]|nr:hypothetical protein [Candidatus Kerfeldbacteria bacterium]
MSSNAGARLALTIALGANVALSSNRAGAELLSLDDPRYGAGSITRDTVTRLEWLDVTQTVGRSFVDVSGRLGPGGAYEGFRHAMASELRTLFVHADIPDVDAGWSLANYRPVRLFHDLVGSVESPVGFRQSVGFVADSPEPGFRKRGFAHSDASAQVGMTDSAGPTDGETSVSTIQGHWLIRPSPVAVEHNAWTAIKRLYD